MAIGQPLSPPSSPTVKTPMKTAMNPLIVKFFGGADERSGGFRGWTFHVSAGEVLASNAVSHAALQKLTEGKPHLW